MAGGRKITQGQLAQAGQAWQWAGMTVVSIRPYTPDDLDTLIALFNGAVRRVAGRDYTPAQIAAWAPGTPDRAAWAARLLGRPTLVAEIEGVIAGFSDLEPDGHIDMLFVDADHQGRGVAGALLDRIETMAREQGLARLFTEASITARPVFEHRGFHVVAAQDVALRGQTLRNYRMAKAL
ncbi:putative acetyltransferase [Brevundimonas abyssalis TAR-001]|uniref:Putative acetyltransferase n=2 Tax=Caulobacteraceae TaxID=76892 RepID=A0A8E0TRH7_9CAUL|nr:putative acetyltransferase [Brevundimonas abyssalis TAR-001]